MGLGSILARKVFRFISKKIGVGIKNPVNIRSMLSKSGLKIGGREFGELYKTARNFVENTGKAKFLSSTDRPGEGTIVKTPWNLGGQYSFRMKAKVRDPVTGEVREEMFTVVDDQNLTVGGDPITRGEIENYSKGYWDAKSKMAEKERKKRYAGELQDISLETVYEKI